MHINLLSELTVVILTYKTSRDILYNCLNSIDKNVKIKIIENSTEFKDKDKFLENFSNLSIDCTGKNLGFGKGNNFGFKKINTKFVLALSPDTICDKNFFDNLKKYLDNKFDFSILGVNFYKEDIKKSGHLSYGYFKKDKTEKNFNETLLEVDWIIGCAMIINLEKFEDKKVFDENIFIYFEDFDLCKNIIKKGKKVFSSKILYIKHIGNSSSNAIDDKHKDTANKFRNWHWRWSQFYFYKKNYSYSYAYRKCFSKLIRYFVMMLAFKILLDKKKSDLNKYSFLGLFNSFIGKKSFYRIE